MRRRPENEVDRWDGTTYRRVICVQDQTLEVSVRQQGCPEAPHLEVNVTGGRVPAEAKAEIATLLTRMFGLQVNLTPFYRMAARDPKLRGLAERFQGLKPVQFPTVFETLANAFACQQFTMAAGLQLLNRLAKLGSRAIETRDGRVFGTESARQMAPPFRTDGLRRRAPCAGALATICWVHLFSYVDGIVGCGGQNPG